MDINKNTKIQVHQPFARKLPLTICSHEAVHIIETETPAHALPATNLDPVPKAFWKNI